MQRSQLSRGLDSPVCDGHGRVFRVATQLEHGRVRVEFENHNAVEMTSEEFLSWREAIRLAGRN